MWMPDPELARTLLRGRVHGALLAEGLTCAVPVCHASDCAGRVMLLVPDGHAVDRTVGGDTPYVVLTALDRPPVPDAPRLGRVNLGGHLHPVPARERRAAVLEFAEAYPVPGLLDVGDTAQLYRVELDEIRVRDTAGQRPVDLAGYLAADPDPLYAAEADILADLVSHHATEVAGFLTAALAAAGVRHLVPPRPVRLDRTGFLVHIGGPHPYARLRFPAPVRDERELARLLHPSLFHGGAPAEWLAEQ